MQKWFCHRSTTMKFSKILALCAITITLMASCSKGNDAVPEIKKGNVAASGKISYKLAGAQVTQDGTGYVLATNHSFIKWESGAQQLSIDFFSMAAGTFTIATGTANAAGTAKITWYPDATTTNWVARTGTFVVSAYSGLKVSGTFTASLEKSVNGTFTGEKMEITEGSFTDVVLRDVR